MKFHVTMRISKSCKSQPLTFKAIITTTAYNTVKYFFLIYLFFPRKQYFAFHVNHLLKCQVLFSTDDLYKTQKSFFLENNNINLSMPSLRVNRRIFHSTTNIIA